MSSVQYILYKIYYLPVVTYGLEPWTWSRRDMSILHAVEMKCLWSMKK